MPENHLNCRLNTVNAIACLIIIANQALVLIFYAKEMLRTGTITEDISLMYLVASCIVLVWAIYRLAQISESTSKRMVNKVMITMHMVAYLVIIIMAALIFVIP